MATNGSIQGPHANSKVAFQDNLIMVWEVQLFFYIIYSIMFLLGLFGNCLVLYVIFRWKTMQSITNYFILNLSLADILLCMLCVPFTPIYTFMQSWVFGEAVCHLVTWSQAISIYVSSLTLTTIAIDRFFVVVYPFRQRMQPSLCRRIILCIWLFSIMATVPYTYFVDHKAIDEDTYVCQEDFPGNVRVTFGTVTTVLQFVVPFFIMTIMYSLISLKLSTRAKCKPGSKSVRKKQADRERKKRTNRMLISMVAVFGLSWLPLNLMNILEDISTNLDMGWEQWKFFHLFFFIAHSIAMSSTCYNPLLYAWLNDSFQKEFKEILPYFGQHCKRRPNNEREIRRISTTCTGFELEPRTAVISCARTTLDISFDHVRLLVPGEGRLLASLPQTDNIKTEEDANSSNTTDNRA